MIEKGRISGLELALIMYATVSATAILYIPYITAQHAKRDLWLSPIWGSLSGFLIVVIIVILSRYFPGKTLIEYCELILGRTIGKIIAFLYLFFLLHDTSIAFREYGEFVESAFLHRTPMLFVTGSIAISCAIAVHGGIQTIGRCAVLFLPIVFVSYVLIYIFLIPDLNLKNMLPIMADGVLPSIKGSLAPHAWLSQYSLMSFLLPLVTKQQKVMKWGIVSVVASVLTMVLMNLGNLFLFGDILINLQFPVFEAARFVSVGSFFEHIESIIIAVWVLGGFIQLSAFFYMVVLGTSQWLKLPSYKPFVLPIGFLIILFSVWTIPSFEDMIRGMGTTVPYYFLTIQLIIPSLLLCVAVIRWKKPKSFMQ
ncbi:endospore germination permease [Neobacillus niacini]|uniref:GerAB/ArcD/ProY family transporter n=1 Tax=Neobacillus niacini TaxID=86668 RepID=UPI0007AB6DD3|nr:endospore germination permease [Neobacillus niacini]MEC1525538.1 endospore germination permease [Neobacillus niacini]